MNKTTCNSFDILLVLVFYLDIQKNPIAGFPLVREKSGKKVVSEKSGNFKNGQGNLSFLEKSGKSQGI